MNQNEFDDSLSEQLRAEAMSQRPAFSAEIHRRALRRVLGPVSTRESPRKINAARLLIAAAAAICVAGGAVAITHLTPTDSISAPAHPIAFARNSATAQSSQEAPSAVPTPSIPLTLDIGGIFSARFEPTEVTVQLSILDQSDLPQSEQAPSPSSTPPLGSPEWLFNRLDEPARTAQAALTEIMPFDFRAAAHLAGSRH